MKIEKPESGLRKTDLSIKETFRVGILLSEELYLLLKYLLYQIWVERKTKDESK